LPSNFRIGRKMATSEPDVHEPRRVVLFGMDCTFTASFMESLLATRAAEIAAVVLPRTEPAAQAAESPRAGLADSLSDVAVIEVSGRRELSSPEFHSSLAGFDSDLIVVACFRWRLPSSVRAVPRIASINVHPSLLPDGRGPEPIFWTLRRGLHTTGVTLHVMDDGLDTGPVIAQRSVAIPSGATVITLERTLARLGADLLGNFLDVPFGSVTTYPQHTNNGWSAPFPDVEDLIVTTSWSVTAAARFINAVSPVYGAIEVLVLANGQRLAVAEVLGIDEGATSASAVQLQEDAAWIRFPDGILHCRLRSIRQRLTLIA